MAGRGNGYTGDTKTGQWLEMVRSVDRQARFQRAKGYLMEDRSGGPRPTLAVRDGVAIIVGVVIGAGIFRTPSLVASNVGSEAAFLGVWIAGGLISLIGALCYAELASTYPRTGGDYHYLTRAFGASAGFLFAWARLTVIQTGSIAVQAFLIGDYASTLLPLGEYSASLYAGLVVAILTALNISGIRQGKWTQNALSGLVLLGLMFVVMAGLRPAGAPPVEEAQAAGPQAAVGLAMVFVLLTYGGWNEAAYLAAEVRGGRRAIARVLLWGTFLVTAIYVLANLAFLRGLGLSGMAGSEVVAADLMRRVAGEQGAALISILIVVAAFGTINATILTGARTTYAWGKDYPLFRFLGHWKDGAETPANALLVQGSIALLLIGLGTATRQGFSTMVEYTAPVFWLFFLMVGLSLLTLRRREPEVPRPFPVPLYPLTPILFCLVCAYMLRASLAYTGVGALAGVLVLLAGVPVLLLANARQPSPQEA